MKMKKVAVAKPQQQEPKFLKLCEVIKEPKGIFITEGEVYSDSELIYHAVIGVDFYCKNEKCESVGEMQIQNILIHHYVN